jgi:acyl-CoA thioesterase I
VAALGERRVVVVGPAAAPSRAAAVVRVGVQLRELTAEAGWQYVDASGWDLPYLPDRLHLTAAGHTAFGDLVRASLR